MNDNDTLTLLYVLFTWLLLIHTFEEIAQGVFELEIGQVRLTRAKYLRAAAVISTVNLGTLALIVSGSRIGLYAGIFTSSVLGILQALVHTVGYVREGRKAERLGAGFYSSVPLALVGLAVLGNILQKL